MANFDGYNPHFPYILGEEWVPIREENLVFNQVTNNVELGQGFSVLSGTQINEARFYINEWPGQLIRNQVWTASIYPRGEEDQSGPIGKVIIPVNDGVITGTGISLVNCSSVATAVADPSDRKYIRIAMGNSNVKAFNAFFAINQYLELLQNKRILGINLLWAAEQITAAQDDIGAAEEIVSGMLNASAQTVLFYPALFAGPSSTDPSLFKPGVTNRMALGDTNVFYPLILGFNAVTGIPWTLDQLQRFENPTANHIEMRFSDAGDSGVGPVISIDYMAMEILYCEERRIGFGSGLYGVGDDLTTRNYKIGVNSIPLFERATLGAGAVVPAGDFTVTLSQGNLGDSTLFFTVNRIGPQPTLNGLRELYSVPAYPGIQVNVPAPPTPDIVGRVFTAEESHILPQLTLQGTSGPVPSVHVYGRQAVSQVWGNNTARQEIYDAGTTPASYPQVRFYARRFGDTTVPLTLSSPTISGSGLNISISPGEWDQLDPIIDNWKEITLQFPTPPTMGTGTNPQWVWSAATETAGNRWEVLGAEAPAVSGVPGYLTKQVNTPDQLWNDTYGQPLSGAGINLSWIPQYAPPVSAARDDQSSDAVVLFSQNPAPVSGFAIVQLNQPLSGIGLQCGLLGPEAPPFIPTALAYNKLSWGLDPHTQSFDDFSRTVVAGWGTSTGGQAWSLSGTAADFNVANGVGTVALATTYRRTTLGVVADAMQNINGYVEVASNATAAVTDHWGSLVFRSDGSGNNEVYAEVNWDQNGNITLILRTVVSGSHVLMGQQIIGRNYVVGTKIAIRVRAIGSNIKAKAWKIAETEPADWQIRADFTSNNNAGQVGTRSITGAGGPSVILSYDNFLVSEITMGYTELQRMDSLTSWQTIMKATDQSVMSFNDYESRVGLLSSYRIRKVNTLGFVGAWSSTITNTIAAPGVTASQVTATDKVWIFTTNSTQSGASNLAYALGWEGEVSEDFNFPESAGQVYQAMYGRDFVTVFRPEERGGTNFSRTVLVQAAAISPEVLEDFTSLRNMAWSDVPYICLRDEAGDRWFANVTVPTGTVLLNRSLYLAPVSIIEVTDTPTPVDP